MIKKIAYFECDDEGTFSIHASVIPEAGQGFDVSTLHDTVKQVVELAQLICRTSDPVITYAYDGRLMFVIQISAEFTHGIKSSPWSLMHAMSDQGWEISQFPMTGGCGDGCCGH